MILTTSAITARPASVIVRESSRTGTGLVQGESSQAASEQGEQAPAGDPRSPSPNDRVNPSPESDKQQQTRTVNARTPDNGLSEQDRNVVEQLKSRDREVRSHEAAHLAAAGSYATSGARFTYQKGPDGQLYAIGGEVGVSTGKIAGDPQATLEKAQRIRAAALAPANPSSQDRAIAAQASRLVTEARREIAVAGIEENTRSDKVSESDNNGKSDVNGGINKSSAEQVYKSISIAANVQTGRVLDIQI